MSNPLPWTPAEDAALLRLRDAEGRCWADIVADLPGRTYGAIKLRYYSALRDRNAVPKQTRRPGRPRRPKVVEQLAPSVSLGRVAAALPTAPLPAAPLLPASLRPRRMSTAILVADAELRARIALQGLTAGLLGDPLPGRSALDERKARGDGGGNG